VEFVLGVPMNIPYIDLDVKFGLKIYELIIGNFYSTEFCDNPKVCLVV